MEKFLLYIKHHCSFIWYIIEKTNDVIFYVMFGKKLETILANVFDSVIRVGDKLTIRVLQIKDASSIFTLLANQKEKDIRYFKPHKFDLKSIKSQLKKRSFLMMGVFANEQLVGYFFLRFFVNKKCFVGRLTDAEYRGQGIGKLMNKIMYQIAWDMNFRCMSTISKTNKLVMRAHKNNSAIKIIKELKNDYLLVEFINEN